MKDIVEFYKNNTGVSAMFEYSKLSKLSNETRDGKHLETSNAMVLFPSYNKVDIDGKEHTIAYNGGEDIYAVYDKYTNKNTGLFMPPPTMQPIVMRGGQIAVQADSTSNTKLLEYLLTTAKYGSTSLKYIEHTPTSVQLNVSEKFDLTTKVVSLMQSAEGYDLVVGMMCNKAINSEWQQSVALKDDKAAMKNIVVSFIQSSKVLPFGSKATLQTIKAMIDKDVLGYNDKVKAFVVKADGKYTDEVFYEVAAKDEQTRILLLDIALYNSKALQLRSKALLS